MDLDDGIAVQPAHDWSHRYTARSADDPTDALETLDAALAADCAVPLSAIDLRMSQQYLGSGACAYIAEVDALALRTPNPMPHMRLFGRSRCRG